MCATTFPISSGTVYSLILNHSVQTGIHLTLSHGILPSRPQDITIFGLLLATICLLLATVLNAKGNKKKGKRPPEPSGRWPLISHLHLLRADKLLHRTLGDMADKYGPIFCVRLGLKRALVVSGWEVAKECYTTNDKVFATRPRSLAIKLMGYDHGSFVFAPCGPYWSDALMIDLHLAFSFPQDEYNIWQQA
ncbi:Methyltetrahydroprotoberberine 14-monooxygenase [Vitis vinifera]|uniref:Methyltetrahydroprotoberberine 14-monooxygenase n=1 Tax=Vitis vinifera TaxID=29760 RepID=A0A438CAY8_VITVI|nr:Methyltetrahydroprotoberberine 14-monooxygenase [Vitis vinifera]